MKNLPLVIVGGIVIVGLAVGGWMFFGKGKPVSGPAEVGEEAPVAPKEESFTGKIKEAILRGVPMKCIWQDDKGNSAAGYIKGKNYYGEITVEGKTGYMIVKDDCVWTWNKGEDQGVKMCFEPTDEEGSIWETENAPQENYNCAPAVVSDSLFNPPADVNFLDMEQLMQGLGE